VNSSSAALKPIHDTLGLLGQDLRREVRAVEQQRHGVVRHRVAHVGLIRLLTVAARSLPRDQSTLLFGRGQENKNRPNLA
jgi:hypothetical protein